MVSVRFSGDERSNRSSCHTETRCFLGNCLSAAATACLSSPGSSRGIRTLAVRATGEERRGESSSCAPTRAPVPAIAPVGTCDEIVFGRPLGAPFRRPDLGPRATGMNSARSADRSGNDGRGSKRRRRAPAGGHDVGSRLSVFRRARQPCPGRPLAQPRSRPTTPARIRAIHQPLRGQRRQPAIVNPYL